MEVDMFIVRSMHSIHSSAFTPNMTKYTAHRNDVSHHLNTDVAQKMYSYMECGYVERASCCGKDIAGYDGVNPEGNDRRVPPPSHHRRNSRESDGHHGAFSLVPPAHTPPPFVPHGSRTRARKPPPALVAGTLSALQSTYASFRGTDPRATPPPTLQCSAWAQALAGTGTETSTGFEEKQESTAGQRDEAPPSPRHRLRTQFGTNSRSDKHTSLRKGAFCYA